MVFLCRFNNKVVCEFTIEIFLKHSEWMSNYQCQRRTLGGIRMYPQWVILCIKAKSKNNKSMGISKFALATDLYDIKVCADFLD